MQIVAAAGPYKSKLTTLDIKVGDVVTRSSDNKKLMDLTVTGIFNATILCAAWKFCRFTGIELTDFNDNNLITYLSHCNGVKLR